MQKVRSFGRKVFRAYPIWYERNACNEIAEKFAWKVVNMWKNVFCETQNNTISVFCDVDAVVAVSEMCWANDED